MDTNSRGYKLLLASGKGNAEKLMESDVESSSENVVINEGFWKKKNYNWFCNRPLSPLPKHIEGIPERSTKINIIQNILLNSPATADSNKAGEKVTGSNKSQMWFYSRPLSPIPTNEIEQNVTDFTTAKINEENYNNNVIVQSTTEEPTDLLYTHAHPHKCSPAQAHAHPPSHTPTHTSGKINIEVEKNEGGSYHMNEESSLLSYSENKKLSDDEVTSSSEEDPYANSDEDPLYVPGDEEDFKGKSNRFLNLLYLDKRITRSARTIVNNSEAAVSENSRNLLDNVYGDVTFENENNLQEPEVDSTTPTLNELEKKGKNNRNRENKLTTGLEISAKKTYKRKPDCCYYCEEEVLNFARHIQRNHSFELEVVKILSKPVKSKERRHLLNNLKRKGNYSKNANECFKPVRKSYIPNQAVLPCDNCLGFFSSKLLYRHKKNCGGNSTKAQASGQSKLIGNIKIDRRLREEVFPTMRPDKISLAVKKDILICAFGARYLKTHREKHFVNVTSRKMRELGRLLLEVKTREQSVKNLFQVLQPKYFDLLVESTKVVANYDPVKDIFCSPTFAMNIVNSLKQCCEIAITFALKRQGHYGTISSAEAEADLKTMIHLLTSNWRYEISSQAATNLDLNKWNKTTIVPLASDLKLLRDYLLKLADSSMNTLKNDNNNISAYNSLLETIYCRVILLNRKRPGELQRMQLHIYLSTNNTKNNYEEFNNAISPTEQILLKTLKRVVIRGKRGRGVPVLFSKDVQEHINYLLEVRSKFVPENNLYLFGKPNLVTPISGYKVLQKHVNACGAQNPSAITSTRLRKHLATLSQIFNMTDNELEQLATFMGHTPGVHKSSYRLPDDVYQTAKVSKLLLLMEKGNAGQFKGKALDEIEIDMEENLLEQKENAGSEEEGDDDCGDDCGAASVDKEMVIEEVPPIVIKKGKKRELVPWTSQQKEIVKKFFKKHIKDKKPPKRAECEELIERHREVLKNKNWLKMKVFIQNEYSKK